jgi:hypothetical protein
MTTTTATTGKFRVERALDGKRWTITEDGDHNCPVDWGQRRDALETLEWIRGQAEKVVRQGYYSTSSPSEIWVKIDGQRTDLVMPYEIIGASERRAGAIRNHAIRWAAMQYFVERASA